MSGQGADAVKVGAARAAAARWVDRHAAGQPWFRGAFFSGSSTWLPAGAELPETSDVDVLVVTAGADPGPRPGKFRYRGALLEVSWLPSGELGSAEEVLASHWLAGSFRTDTVIADPTGLLGRLRAQVSGRFADPVWVRRRCDSALRRIEDRLRAFDVSAPLHEQVTAWLFPTGVTTHVLLVAALRNPTVRLRYLAAREVLRDHGLPGFHEELLELLGCARLGPERVAHHLEGLARTFDAAAAAARTPFFFSSDLTPAARPIAIDGSRRLVETGAHREAVFWIAATYARCHAVLAADAAPRVRRSLLPAFEDLLDDLGVAGTRDLLRRGDELRRFLPRLRAVAEVVLAGGAGAVPVPPDVPVDRPEV